MCKPMQRLERQTVMALRFIGKDPDSPNNGSPTVWLDEEDGSIVIQGWQIDGRKYAGRGHGGESRSQTMRRWSALPARMAPFLMEVCDGDGAAGVRPVSRG